MYNSLDLFVLLIVCSTSPFPIRERCASVLNLAIHWVKLRGTATRLHVLDILPLSQWSVSSDVIVPISFGNCYLPNNPPSILPLSCSLISMSSAAASFIKPTTPIAELEMCSAGRKASPKCPVEHIRSTIRFTLWHVL